MKKLLLFIVIFLLLFTLFLPTLASTALGRKILAHAIEKKTSGKIEMQSLKLRWFGPQKIEQLVFTSPELNFSSGSVESDAPLLRFFSKDNFKGSFEVKNVQADVKYPGYPEVIFSDLNAKVTITPSVDFSVKSALLFPANGQKGSIDVIGSVKNPSKDLSQLTCTASANVQNFPAYALKALMPDKKDLLTFLGEKINFKGDIRWENGSGPIQATLDSSGIKGDLLGRWDKETLFLDKPLTLAFHLTPEISESLLSSVSPFFLTGIEAKNPVYVSIAPQGFSLKYPFALKDLTIQNGELDMGKIICQNGSSLNNAISLLKFNLLTGVRQMEVWFTPVNFSLKDGYLETGRMDFLISRSLHLCSWGDIDLSEDQLHMILGITNNAMQTSFGIQGLPANYVMQIPVTGTRKNPKIDLKAAGAKIAALLALQTAGKKIPFGGIIGGVFGQITEPAAPPPRRPFPWER